MEKKVSVTCIETPDYGTRVSTVIMMNKRGQVSVTELNRLTGESNQFEFSSLRTEPFAYGL
jgi:uncharacterized protein with NRDE domain